MKIKKATLKDLKKIYEIIEKSEIDEYKLEFSKKSYRSIAKELEKKKRKNLTELKKELSDKNRIFLLAEIDNDFVGVGEAYWYGKFGGLSRLHIKKDFRRLGIAKKLTEERIAYLEKKKVKEIETFIFDKNNPSLKLHKRHGFKKDYALARFVKKI
jgi:ribosomal protein S18 acetylase RimI-like enzyme